MAGVPLCPRLSRGCFWDVIRKMPRAAVFATGRRRPHGLQFWGDFYVRCDFLSGKVAGTILS